jgi:hypothetical protein
MTLVPVFRPDTFSGVVKFCGTGSPMRPRDGVVPFTELSGGMLTESTV